MKKSIALKIILITISLIFIQNLAKAQLNISTEGAEYQKYDTKTKDWINDGEDTNKVTLLEINEDATVMKHTTNTGKSTYYVKSFQKHVNSANQDVFNYTVMSDTGNSYDLFINPTDKTFKCIYSDDNGKLMCVVFFIKRIFK